MKSPVISIESSKTIQEAAQLMHKNKIGSLIIKKGDTFDIITERDVLKAVAENKLDVTLDTTMEDPLVTINQNEAIGQAAQKMIVKGFRRLVVVDDNENIVGILTIRDVVVGVHETFLALFDA